MINYSSSKFCFYFSFLSFLFFSDLLIAQSFVIIHFSDGSVNGLSVNNAIKIVFDQSDNQINYYMDGNYLFSDEKNNVHKLTFDSVWTGSVLPVELANFKGKVNGKVVSLSWNTLMEIGTVSFQIEKQNKNEWVKIGEVKAIGNSNSLKSYSFSDNNSQPGKLSYRLKILNLNGKFNYSNLITIDLSTPLVFAVSQNYPNPFNPSTTISYQIPKTGLVNITIYDIRGREIKTLLNSSQEPGNYNQIWNGVNNSGYRVSSGVYFYRIKYNSASFIKKMLLVK